MKPVFWKIICTAAFLVSCSNPKRTSMPLITPGLLVSALQQTPSEHVHSLRLASDGKSISVAGMTANPDGMHHLFTIVLESDPPGAPQPLCKLASPFGTPFWDVSFTPEGFATVWTRPGSAISSLGYRAPGKEAITLTSHYPSGVFQHPRFVRGNPALAVTATAMQADGGEALVLFQDGLESGQSQYRLLPAAEPGTLLEGLLIRQGKGYLLLAKYATPALGAAERTDLRGESVSSGVLRGMRLNADFRPVDSVFSPLGDSAAFEFDADIRDERVYLLATTAQGYKAAVGVIAEDAWHWIRAPEIVMTRTTHFSPAVHAQGQSSAAVFLSANESGPPSILHGRISIEKR